MSASFGQFIKELRIDKEITIKELASMSGVSAAQISRLESGVRKSSKPETVKALADALGVDHKTAMERAGYGFEDEEKTLTNEQEFIKDIEREMTDEELLAKYPITIDGRTLTSAEAKGVIAFVRAQRSLGDNDQ
ncbi:helix-turn-helix domain-containing protein [Shouchella lehensis]|uniref:HTH-type transcriptional repressor n=1 Tax=Shouchella lehensis G1 TaxID=1246626 RepID=A0A060LVY4_9BACI|nr:helix-turn-helix transcriptional regulator [Shouchella lehensis]AIC95416.1 HTH-type transcriptional repressor [Shouchella lehensis G1]